MRKASSITDYDSATAIRGRLFSRRLIPAAVILLGLGGCGGGDRPDERTVTLMSYNVENLFDLNLDGTEHPAYRPGESWDHESHARKLSNIASVIEAARPDIAALQEVENAVAAEQLRAALGLRGLHYPALAVGDSPNRTVTCPVVFSRFPVTGSRGHAVVMPDGMPSRNLLEADIALGADTLKLFVCHWPSKHHPESWRMAAARVLATRLAALSPGLDYLIAGDLNAGYDECETMTACGHDDTKGVTGINHVLRTVESAAGSFVDYVTLDELAATTNGMYHADPWLELEPRRRWNYRFRGRPDTPDHLLVPAALLDDRGLSYVNGSYRVFRWNGRLLWDGAPYRWRLRRRREGVLHEGRGYSDHLPLLAELRSGAYRRRTPPDSPPARTASGTIGFESSAEGWVAWSAAASVIRDTVATGAGRYCLRVRAMPSDNQTVARAVLVPGRYGLRAGSRVSLMLRGAGKCVLRTRRGDDAWRYWCWETNAFALRGRPRYRPVRLDRWHTAVLEAGGAPEKPVELELRAGKGAPLEMWVDEVRVEK